MKPRSAASRLEKRGLEYRLIGGDTGDTTNAVPPHPVHRGAVRGGPDGPGSAAGTTEAAVLKVVPPARRLRHVVEANLTGDNASLRVSNPAEARGWVRPTAPRTVIEAQPREHRVFTQARFNPSSKGERPVSRVPRRRGCWAVAFAQDSEFQLWPMRGAWRASEKHTGEGSGSWVDSVFRPDKPFQRIGLQALSLCLTPYTGPLHVPVPSPDRL